MHFILLYTIFSIVNLIMMDNFLQPTLISFTIGATLIDNYHFIESSGDILDICFKFTLFWFFLLCFLGLFLLYLVFINLCGLLGDVLLVLIELIRILSHHTPDLLQLFDLAIMANRYSFFTNSYQCFYCFITLYEVTKSAYVQILAFGHFLRRFVQKHEEINNFFNLYA